VGAVIIVATNGFLYPLAARMDRLHFQAGREVTPVDYILEVACQRNAEPVVRSKLIEAVTAPGLMLKSLAQRDGDARTRWSLAPTWRPPSGKTHGLRARFGR
jgi:putative Mg2+ transporter-C (MgtC) family protein